MAVNAKVASAYVDLVARTEAFKKAMDDATGQVRNFHGQMRAETEKSREGLRLLTESMGVGMPRALTNVISKLPMVTTAMNAAFDAVIVIGLIDMVVKVGTKIEEFVKKNEDAARKNREAWAATISSINQENDSLELTKTKLENAIAKLEHKPQNKLKEAIEEAKVAADELGRKLDEDIKKVAETLKGEEHNWASQMFLKQTGPNAAAGISADAQFRLSQISAGTYKGGTGDPTADREKVIEQALSDANAKLGPAQAILDQLTANLGSRVPDASKDAVRSLTELIAALKGMETTATVTGQVAGLRGQEGKLTADNEASADELRSFQSEFAARKQMFGMDVAAEMTFWGSKLSAFKKGSEQYLSVLEKFSQAEAAFYKEMKEATARETSTPPTLANKPDGIDELTAAYARNSEAIAANNLKTMEARDKAELLTGAITPHQVALDMQAAHTAEYTDKLTALQDQLAALKQEQPEALGGFSNQQIAKQVDVGTQIEDLNSARSTQAQEDTLAVVTSEGSAFRQEMRDMFQDWIHYSTDLRSVTRQLFEDMKKAVDTMNDEIIKAMTGQKTNWRGAARSTLTGFAKTGLETAEGGLMKALGLGGHAKADGYHVHVDNMPGVPGTAGNIVSKSGGGLLGMLNDSNFFSSLFGGRVFGAGGFFGGGHALGGAVAAGVPIDVGELGVERFTPMVPGTITSNRDMPRGGTVMHIDARGTDPALTRENFQRALAQTHAQAVRDASRAMYERNRRVA